LNTYIYCFDTSSVIELNRKFFQKKSLDVIQNIEALINSGRLIIHEIVVKEIRSGKDDIIKWVNKNPIAVRKIDQDQWNLAQRIIQNHQSWFPSSKEEFADPWVIALAAIENDRNKDTLFNYVCVVVAEESQKKERLKMRTICQEYSIECINLEEMFRRENWNI